MSKKIKVVLAVGCVAEGKPQEKGAELTLPEADARSLLAMGRAVKPETDEAKEVAKQVAAEKKAAAAAAKAAKETDGE